MYSSFLGICDGYVMAETLARDGCDGCDGLSEKILSGLQQQRDRVFVLTMLDLNLYLKLWQTLTVSRHLRV